MQKPVSATALAVAIGLTALPGTASADVTRAELMAYTCLACHGAAGSGPNDTIPSLTNGYPARVIERQLKAFREGTRPATVMQRHATGYSDEEIEALANHFQNMQ